MLQVSTDELASALTTDIQYLKGKSLCNLTFPFLQFLGLFQVGELKKLCLSPHGETVCMDQVPKESFASLPTYTPPFTVWEHFCTPGRSFWLTSPLPNQPVSSEKQSHQSKRIYSRKTWTFCGGRTAFSPPFPLIMGAVIYWVFMLRWHSAKCSESCHFWSHKWSWGGHNYFSPQRGEHSD